MIEIVIRASASQVKTPKEIRVSSSSELGGMIAPIMGKPMVNLLMQESGYAPSLDWHLSPDEALDFAAALEAVARRLKENESRSV